MIMVARASASARRTSTWSFGLSLGYSHGWSTDSETVSLRLCGV